MFGSRWSKRRKYCGGRHKPLTILEFFGKNEKRYRMGGLGKI
jgi:hypothetical protein